MTGILFVAGIALLLAAIVLRRRATLAANSLQMEGEVTYDDMGGDLLVSDRYGLVGRPDYIVRNGPNLVPVERKSRPLGRHEPYDGEVLQLAAYCLLVEERYGSPVRMGKLQYADRTLDVEFDAHLKQRLLEALEAIRESDRMTDVPRSHETPQLCRGCGYKQSCGLALSR